MANPSLIKFNLEKSRLNLDRFKVKQYYDCFPEYIYNTAFGSLLTDPNCIVDNEGSMSLCNNSAWNDDRFIFQYQSISDVIRILVDFLDEFLLFLSSILQCQSYHSQCQRQKLVHVVERIHQLHSTLLIQLNNINSAIIDISSLSLILHELASLIHCLNNEQTIIEHPPSINFTQVLNRLDQMIQSCINYISMNNNSQVVYEFFHSRKFPSEYIQIFQPFIPPLFPCLSSTPCLSPCNGCNACMPWMYGVKDEYSRRKFVNGIGVQTSPNRTKRKRFSNDQVILDGNQQWMASSTDDQILSRRGTPSSSPKKTPQIIGYKGNQIYKVDIIS